MKIEMHAHTSEASPCANVSATKIPALYQKAGYDAIVITDHYCKWAQDRSGLTDNDDYVQYFLNGYRSARKAAGQIGFTVLLRCGGKSAGQSERLSSLWNYRRIYPHTPGYS